MTLQKRLQRIMKRRGWRVADLARELDEPYTTVREWVLKGRIPGGPVGVKIKQVISHLDFRS
jgi:hypothetical protein